MSDGNEEAIRARAFAIWEAQGHPHGLEDEHWRQAEAELADAAQAGEGADVELPNPLASGAAAKAMKTARRKKA